MRPKFALTSIWVRGRLQDSYCGCTPSASRPLKKKRDKFCSSPRSRTEVATRLRTVTRIKPNYWRQVAPLLALEMLLLQQVVALLHDHQLHYQPLDLVQLLRQKHLARRMDLLLGVGSAQVNGKRQLGVLECVAKLPELTTPNQEQSSAKALAESNVTVQPYNGPHIIELPPIGDSGGNDEGEEDEIESHALRPEMAPEEAGERPPPPVKPVRHTSGEINEGDDEESVTAPLVDEEQLTVSDDGQDLGLALGGEDEQTRADAGNKSATSSEPITYKDRGASRRSSALDRMDLSRRQLSRRRWKRQATVGGERQADQLGMAIAELIARGLMSRAVQQRRQLSQLQAMLNSNSQPPTSVQGSSQFQSVLTAMLPVGQILATDLLRQTVENIPVRLANVGRLIANLLLTLTVGNPVLVNSPILTRLRNSAVTPASPSIDGALLQQVASVLSNSIRALNNPQLTQAASDGHSVRQSSGPGDPPKPDEPSATETSSANSGSGSNSTARDRTAANGERDFVERLVVLTSGQRIGELNRTQKARATTRRTLSAKDGSTSRKHHQSVRSARRKRSLGSMLMFGPFGKLYMAMMMHKMMRYQTGVVSQAVMSELVRRYVLPSFTAALTGAPGSQSLESGKQLLNQARQLFSRPNIDANSKPQTLSVSSQQTPAASSESDLTKLSSTDSHQNQSGLLLKLLGSAANKQRMTNADCEFHQIGSGLSSPVQFSTPLDILRLYKLLRGPMTDMLTAALDNPMLTIDVNRGLLINLPISQSGDERLMPFNPPPNRPHRHNHNHHHHDHPHGQRRLPPELAPLMHARPHQSGPPAGRAPDHLGLDGGHRDGNHQIDAAKFNQHPGSESGQSRHVSQELFDVLNKLEQANRVNAAGKFVPSQSNGQIDDQHNRLMKMLLADTIRSMSLESNRSDSSNNVATKPHDEAVGGSADRLFERILSMWLESSSHDDGRPDSERVKTNASRQTDEQLGQLMLRLIGETPHTGQNAMGRPGAAVVSTSPAPTNAPTEVSDNPRENQIQITLTSDDANNLMEKLGTLMDSDERQARGRNQTLARPLSLLGERQQQQPAAINFERANLSDTSALTSSVEPFGSLDFRQDQMSLVQPNEEEGRKFAGFEQFPASSKTLNSDNYRAWQHETVQIRGPEQFAAVRPVEQVEHKSTLVSRPLKLRAPYQNVSGDSQESPMVRVAEPLELGFQAPPLRLGGDAPRELLDGQSIELSRVTTMRNRTADEGMSRDTSRAGHSTASPKNVTINLRAPVHVVSNESDPKPQHGDGRHQKQQVSRPSQSNSSDVDQRPLNNLAMALNVMNMVMLNQRLMTLKPTVSKDSQSGLELSDVQRPTSTTISGNFSLNNSKISLPINKMLKLAKPGSTSLAEKKRNEKLPHRDQKRSRADSKQAQQHEHAKLKHKSGQMVTDHLAASRVKGIGLGNTRLKSTTQATAGGKPAPDSSSNHRTSTNSIRFNSNLNLADGRAGLPLPPTTKAPNYIHQPIIVATSTKTPNDRAKKPESERAPAKEVPVTSAPELSESEIEHATRWNDVLKHLELGKS